MTNIVYAALASFGNRRILRVYRNGDEAEEIVGRNVGMHSIEIEQWRVQ